MSRTNPLGRAKGATDGAGTLAAIPRASRANLAYDVLKQAIIEHRIAPGERINETQLAETLTISKTPLREALALLKEAGLVVPDGGNRYKILKASKADVVELYQLREALETFAARRIAAHGTEIDLDAIESSANGSLEAALSNDFSRFSDCDMEFHVAVVRAVGNARLLKQASDVLTLISIIRLRDTDNEAVSVQCGQQHVLVAEAISDRDPERAAVLLGEHIHAVGARVIDQISAAAPG